MFEHKDNEPKRMTPEYVAELAANVATLTERARLADEIYAKAEIALDADPRTISAWREAKEEYTFSTRLLAQARWNLNNAQTLLAIPKHE